MQGPIDSDDGQEEEKEPEESPHGHALPPPHHETMRLIAILILSFVAREAPHGTKSSLCP